MNTYWLVHNAYFSFQFMFSTRERGISYAELNESEL